MRYGEFSDGIDGIRHDECELTVREERAVTAARGGSAVRSVEILSDEDWAEAELADRLVRDNALEAQSL